MALSVSVALCTRNGARYLPAQVQSICAQDLLPRQIVLSDDASTDGSVDVVRNTLARSHRAAGIALRVCENERPLGVTRNFEQAVGACEHELIALCDQDDLWHPGRLARMVAPFEVRPDLSLLHSDARLVDAQLAPLGGTLFEALEVRPAELEAIAQGRAFEVLLRRNLATGATIVFRRSLLTVAFPFSLSWVHDEWLAVIAATTGRMDVLPEALIDYRQHGNNQIGAKRASFADKVRKAMDTRGTKHVDRMYRAEALLERLMLLRNKVPAAYIDAQREKLAHQRFRADLPPARLARVLPVLKEALAGRYDRFGRGQQAVMQDLLEKG